jgi:signal peptidase I
MKIKEIKRISRHLNKSFKRHIKHISEDHIPMIEAALRDLDYAIKQGDLEAATECYATLEQYIEVILQSSKKSAWREFAEPVLVALFITLFLWAFVIEAFKIPSRSMVPTLLDGDHIFVNKLAYGLRLPFTNWNLIRFSAPARGDVVVFVFSQHMAIDYLDNLAEHPSLRECAPPDNLKRDTEDKDYIKRVIGLPGDTIQMINHALYINGTPIPRLELYHRLLDGRQSLEGDQIWVEEELNNQKYLTYHQAEHTSGDFGPITVKDDHIFVMGDNRDLSFDSRCWGQVPMNNIKGKALIVWWSNAPRHGVRWARLFTRTQ